MQVNTFTYLDLQKITEQGATTNQQIVTTVTGVSPFQVSSEVVVEHLNADLWDGNQFSTYINQAIKTTSEPTFNRVTLTATPFYDTDATTKTYVDTYFPVQESNMFLNNVSTLNVSTAKHGFVPILPNNADLYFNGIGNYATPTGTSDNDYSVSVFSGVQSGVVLHNFNNYPITQVLISGIVINPETFFATVTHSTANSLIVNFTVPRNFTVIASLGSPQPQKQTIVSSNYTILSTDRIIRATSAGSIITCPNASGVAGFEFVIDNNSTGDVYLSGLVGQPIQGEILQTIPLDSALNFYSTGSSWRIY